MYRVMWIRVLSNGCDSIYRSFRREFFRHRQLLKIMNDRSGIRLQDHLIEDKIAHFEKRIDELVYQLYDLTAEEIAIVENA